MQSIGKNKLLQNLNKNISPETLARIKEQVLADSEIQAFIKKHTEEISDQMIEKSLPKLYQFYHQKKHPDEVLAGYQAELFLNVQAIDVRYTKTSRKLAQEKDEETKRHLELIDLPQNLHNIRLSQVDITPGRTQALSLIRQFLNKYAQNSHLKGLYLSGSFGVGKTYLLAGLANQVAAMGKEVIFLHVPTFIASLASHFADNSLQSEIKRIAESDLVIFDDIGAESLSQWSRDDVLGVILQARMDNILPTFFSSNIDLKSLEEHFKETKNAIDPVKAARLMARINFLAKEVVVSGKDRRQ